VRLYNFSPTSRHSCNHGSRTTLEIFFCSSTSFFLSSPLLLRILENKIHLYKRLEMSTNLVTFKCSFPIDFARSAITFSEKGCQVSGYTTIHYQIQCRWTYKELTSVLKSLNTPSPERKYYWIFATSSAELCATNLNSMSCVQSEPLMAAKNTSREPSLLNIAKKFISFLHS
jgi:hypothetical protein